MQLKENVLLTVASLLSILFLIFHIADDIVRGFEKGDLSNYPAIPIALVWLCGTLLLAERRSGYVIMLLGSILGAGIPILHMMGKGVGVHSRIGKTPGAFFFVFTLLAIGVTSLFSVILASRGLYASIKGADGRMTAAANESPDRRR